jgi:hypothetical protein
MVGKTNYPKHFSAPRCRIDSEDQNPIKDTEYVVASLLNSESLAKEKCPPSLFQAKR